MAYNPVRLPSASAPSIGQYKIDSFLGCDLTGASANVSLNRAPVCSNMIRESRGKVRKWIGWRTSDSCPNEERINGVYFLINGSNRRRIVHAGTTLYAGDAENGWTTLYSGVNDTLSTAKQMGGRLCFFDGKKMLLITPGDNDQITVVTAESEAYVPTIIISRNPTGGGTAYEPVNLLGKRRTEQFLGTASDTVYQLSANLIEAGSVTVEKMNAQGEFEEMDSGFTVDTAAGKVTFSTAPGASPVTGEDNIKITYAKTVSGYSDRIDKATVAVIYGVGGNRDRLFAAGNPDFPNRDIYSQLDDPTYFGDLWYAQFGQENSRIMGYSVVSDKLAVHLDQSDDGTNLFLRSSSLINGEAAFTLSGSLQGAGAVSSHAFAVLENEPLFAVPGEVMAITPSDISGERYTQTRGYYLKGMLQTLDMRESYACVYNQFYMLACSGYLFALDATQASYERNAPYSTRQYEAYYRENVPARVLYEENGTLCFGTSDGHLCAFYTDYDDRFNFNDDGTAIHALWQTPEFYGKDFYNPKTFRSISVLLASGVATGCRIWALYDGIRELLRDYDGTARYFSFSNLTFSKLSFKTDKSPQDLVEKIKIKKIKKIQFIFENDVVNEPFGLYMATSEFIESR